MKSAFHLAYNVRDLDETRAFYGEPGEQWTMFFYDPCGNSIEVKGFADFDGIFAS